MDDKTPLAATTAHQVPFSDVDSYRVVWHGHYPHYFELARCLLLEKIGCPYDEMERQHYFFPVVDLQIKYVRPLHFKQNILISATLKEWENRLKIEYAITDNETGKCASRGHTTQVAVLMPDQITQYASPVFLVDRVRGLIT